MDEELWARWSADLGRHAASRQVFDELCARYREPHRRYHTLVHVVRVLRAAGELLGDQRADRTDAGLAARALDPVVGADQAVAVRLAAWFHDAVYDPRSPGNEADSAALAARQLAVLGQPAERIELVQELVLATATHTTAGATHPAATAVLLDADLAVLAADPSTYQAYVDGVRAEYAHVADDAWRRGRGAVLRGLLGRTAIFHVPPVEPRERTARANLSAELARWSPPDTR